MKFTLTNWLVCLLVVMVLGSSTLSVKAEANLAVTVPTPLSPGGTISDTTPTYQWTKIDGATKYKIELYTGTTRVYALWPSASLCGATTCTKTPTTPLDYGSYRWRVQAYVDGVWETYSSYKYFVVEENTPAEGFTSWFGSSAWGWKVLKGEWIVNSNGWYQTNGIVGVLNSVMRTDEYTTLTYEAKVKRTSDPTSANRLIIRGTPYPLDSTNKNWYNGYMFQYTNNGTFSVFKYVNGVSTELQGWTSYAGIKGYSWNKLKVTASGSNLKFYINGGLVWEGTDDSLSIGKIGIGMYRGNYGWNPLSVDWAKLTTSVSTAALDEPMAVGIGEPVIGWDNPDFAPDVQDLD